jgi:hypothetical protein
MEQYIFLDYYFSACTTSIFIELYFDQLRTHGNVMFFLYQYKSLGGFGTWFIQTAVDKKPNVIHIHII